MSEALSGLDIGKIMAEAGTIVKCVLLRCGPVKSEDGSGSSKADVVDKPLCSMTIKEMKRELESYDVDASKFVEKDELVKALEGARSTRAHHSTEQPPSPTSESAVVTQEDANETSAGHTELKPQQSSPDTTPVPLAHLIHEISVDTTPRKSQVASILGGDFTFLGQYESEGIMVMVRRPDWQHDPDWREEDIPLINPHKLQPPLKGVEVRGDILLMRVAETNEELDEENDNDENENHKEDDTQLNSQDTVAKIHVPSSEEFFLDYTREEYLKFAARTDIVWEEPEEEDEEAEEEEEDDCDETTLCVTNCESNGEAPKQSDDNEEQLDPSYEPDADSSDEEYDSEEHQIGMMNLILGQILRKFHEENGRGPNTLELLDMRKNLADRLGVEVPEVDQEACDWNKKVETPKRHNKKVVVDEERNKCETIQCGEDHDDGVELDEEGLDGEHEQAVFPEKNEEVEISSQQPPTGFLESGESVSKEQEQEAGKTAILEEGSESLKRSSLEIHNGECASDEHVAKRTKRSDEVNLSAVS
ncbi:hypothetical protein HJC23_003525 [Cyclotella cryptica]|uniref:EF-hand domain-containing protein n=1 Tax=Cyclotella cryptica TaxID=29204 RepID=A0ABD3NXV4_9STRA|eukprot:CCRYP_018884-RA/>CCRYP_018884-RA protein AED:0.00 eAED:0.00 QI:221/-1/1/1/-1/1/1/163/532